jgi:hypothetical protein
MGYRGEDASRTRADSRRQPPWQSSSAGPGAARPWDDGSQGYGEGPRGYDGQHGEYAADDGYRGYPQGNPYAGYDEYEAYRQGDGYGPSGGYGQPPGYGQRARYGGDGSGYRGDDGYGGGEVAGYGHADPYGYPGGASGGYPQSTGYSDGYGHPPQGYGGGGNGQPAFGYPAGGYPAGGYAGSGDYPAQPAGPRTGSGGYPALTAGSGHSGGYPVQGSPVQGSPVQGSRLAGRADVPGRYAGSDWYGGQPGPASGPGFADTGTYAMDARVIDAYGTGPRAAIPPGLVRTGQQERYDDEYGPYPEHGSPYPEHDGPYPEHGSPYPEHDGPYPEHGSPYPEHDGPYPEHDGRADDGDPYPDRYGDAGPAPRPAGDGTAPRPASARGAKGNAGKNAKGKARKSARGKAAGSGRKRPLLLAALGIAGVAVLAAAVYVFLLRPKPSADTSAAAGPLPTAGSASPGTANCVKQFGPYCHITLRTDDPEPLTLDELFPPQFVNETDHASFTRVATRLDKTCANAVVGQDLVNALQNGKCTQVLRASYVSGDNKIMGTIGVVNLGTTNEAHYAGKVVGANDFVMPLSTSKGLTSKLGKGTGVVEAEFKGHYLILTWAEFTSTNAPKTQAENQQLEQFENDLVTGTANISLSQRMVNGKPATPGAAA